MTELAQVPAATVESRALAAEALDAIASVKTPDEAEQVLARVRVAAEAARVMHLGKELSREWRNVELKAERKWGELLGKADKQGHRTDLSPEPVTDGNKSPSGAERKAAHEARKIAAVPEPVFEQYVAEAKQPSKAGVLRAANTQPNGSDSAATKPEPVYTQCPSCGQRVRADKPLRPRGAT